MGWSVDGKNQPTPEGGWNQALSCDYVPHVRITCQQTQCDVDVDQQRQPGRQGKSARGRDGE